MFWFWWVYLGLSVATILPLGRCWLEGLSGEDDEPETFDRAMALILGVLCATMWPFTVAALLLYRIGIRFNILTTSTERKRIKENELELREQEIERAERVIRAWDLEHGRRKCDDDV